jgi:hypothetical protein
MGWNSVWSNNLETKMLQWRNVQFVKKETEKHPAQTGSVSSDEDKLLLTAP